MSKTKRGSGRGARKKEKMPRGFWKDVVERVTTLAEPVCEELGIELVYIEFHRETGGRILRLYIDKPGGVMLDDCMAVSRQLSDLLDVKLDQDLTYRLEVSSPGPDRPIGKKGDFDRFKTHRARIRTSKAIDGQKTFTGNLLGLFEDGVRLDKGGDSVSIPLEVIKKAQLVNYQGDN